MSEIGHNGGPVIERSNAGWVAISRAIRSHWLVGFGQPVKPMDPSKGALSRAEAFIDLIMECRYEAGAVTNGGRKMELQAGQMIGAVSWLANRWNWTPQTVRTWLDKLEDEGMIERSTPGVHTENNKQSGKQAGVITLCNYSDYQLVRDVIEQENQQASNKQATSTQQASNNIYKDNKETRKQGNKVVTPQPPKGGSDPIAEQFEVWWEVFPKSSRKVAKGECLALFRQAVTGHRKSGKRGQKVLEHGTVSASDLIAAARAYAATSPDPEFTPAPATWLNQGRWLDQPETPDPSPVNGKTWGWWRGVESKLKALPLDRWRKADADAKPNGTWPWWILGPPPGHSECVMPDEIIAEKNYIAIYGGKITHV